MTSECVALISIVGTLIGTVLGAGLTFVVQRSIMRRQQRGLFRLAVLDKRMQRYQEAHALWDELTRWLNGPGQNADKCKAECQEWLRHNRLYLSPQVRNEFRDALWRFNLYPCGTEINVNEHVKADHQILGLGQVIEDAVDLLLNTAEEDSCRIECRVWPKFKALLRSGQAGSRTGS